MAVAAQLQFLQPGGGGTGTPGQALAGSLALPVTVKNFLDNGQVVSWTFEVVDVPSGSTVPTGVVQQGTIATYVFTPDLRGAYLLHLTVRDLAGNFAEDYRVFQVAETTGRFIPSFKSDSLSYNRGGGKTGWSTDVINYLKAVDAGGGGGVSLAGDLLGTGSTSGVPRVGAITGIAGTLAIATTAALLQWAATTSAPTLSQAAASGAGQALTIAAQTAGGVNQAGGALNLASGAKAGVSSHGAINLQLGGATVLSLLPNISPTLQFATGAGAPTVNQADNTTNSATASTLTIQAQNATGTTSTGGNVQLTSGNGTTAVGSIGFAAATSQLGKFETQVGTDWTQTLDAGRVNFILRAPQTGQNFLLQASTATGKVEVDAATLNLYNHLGTATWQMIQAPGGASSLNGTGAGASLYTVGQASGAFSGAAANPFTVQAQANSSATANSFAGGLQLYGGASTSASATAVGGAITAATNATPIQITTTSAHGLVTGQMVRVAAVTGNVNANGDFVVTVVNATNYTLNNSIGSGAYVSGGTTTPLGLGGPTIMASGAAAAGAANAGYLEFQTGAAGTNAQLRITSSAIWNVQSLPLKFGMTQMGVNAPGGAIIAGTGLIQFGKTTVTTAMITINDGGAAGGLTLPIISTTSGSYSCLIGDDVSHAGTNWSSMNISAASITLNTASSVGVQPWNKNANATNIPIVEFYQGATGISALSVFADGTANTVVKPKDNATNSATGFTLTLQGQSATGTTSTGGDLTLGGGTGTSANGVVNLVNQTVATTATAFAGGAVIPATCGYLPVKIGGTLRKLVVVQT